MSPWDLLGWMLVVILGLMIVTFVLALAFGLVATVRENSQQKRVAEARREARKRVLMN